MKRIVVAMSGGVDSSVAACLLQEQGYDVVGVFLRTGVESADAGGRHRGCCSAADAGDARLVADRLGIAFYSLDFAAEFSGVMDYFADEYVRGRTPNPCVVCNSTIKFGRLWEISRSLGADYLATGHYARLAERGGEWTLRQARDRQKDQTYVLFGIPSQLLDRVRFPLGELTKKEVRETARRAGLLVAEKPDSQDICFVPDGDAARFVRGRRGDAFAPGDLVDAAGNVLGRHDGIARFTVGQRKGLGLDRSKLRGERKFVLSLLPEKGQVVLGGYEESLVRRFRAQRCNWLVPRAIDGPADGLSCQVKWSHRGSPREGTVRPAGGQDCEVRLSTPQPGIAPGQAVVFYQDDWVVGGGWIAETAPSL